MKIGKDYIHSIDKRLLDIAIAAPLLPVKPLGIFVARLSYLPAEVSALQQQERLGANSQPFILEKIRTINDETGEPYAHRFAHAFRGTGIDEIAQAKQIVGGQMSMVGCRPLPLEDRNKLFEYVSDDKEGHDLIKRHMGTVALARPGLVSSAGMRIHAGSRLSANEYIAMNIEDFEKASTVHDLTLIRTYLQNLLGGALTDSTVRSARPD